MEPYTDNSSYQSPPDNYMRRRRVLLLSIIAPFALVVVMGSYSLYRNLQFDIVKTNPPTSQVATITPFFDVTFSKPLATRGISLSATDKIIQSYNVKGNTLVIALTQTLQPNKTYTITINSIYSTTGRRITGKRFTFSPQNVAFNSLPKDQQNAIVGNQDHYAPVQQDPILRDLPYSTLDFSLNATFPQDKSGNTTLVLQAQLLLAPGVSGAEATSDEAQYKQEVLDYVKSLGLDPSKYAINYEVVQESLSGV